MGSQVETPSGHGVKLLPGPLKLIIHTAKSDGLSQEHAEVSGGHTERAVLRLVGRSNHWQASADPAAAGETCWRVGLGHGIQGLQGGQREVVHLVSDAGLGAGAVFRASALGVKEDTLLWDDT